MVLLHPEGNVSPKLPPRGVHVRPHPHLGHLLEASLLAALVLEPHLEEGEERRLTNGRMRYEIKVGKAVLEPRWWEGEERRLIWIG